MRKRLPDIPYEVPPDGAIVFTCEGACGLVWSIEMRRARNRCLNCARAERRARYDPVQQRRAHLKKYGTTPEQVEDQLQEQEWRCEICAQEVEPPRGPGGRARTAHVDHDHRTGKPRGILCARCNTGLGSFEDDAHRLRAAAVYVERWAARHRYLDEEAQRTVEQQRQEAAATEKVRKLLRPRRKERFELQRQKLAAIRANKERGLR